jgi:hypothetical protein
VGGDRLVVIADEPDAKATRAHVTGPDWPSRTDTASGRRCGSLSSMVLALAARALADSHIDRKARVVT